MVGVALLAGSASRGLAAPPPTSLSRQLWHRGSASEPGHMGGWGRRLAAEGGRTGGGRVEGPGPRSLKEAIWSIRGPHRWVQVNCRLGSQETPQGRAPPSVRQTEVMPSTLRATQILPRRQTACDYMDRAGRGWGQCELRKRRNAIVLTSALRSPNRTGTW